MPSLHPEFFKTGIGKLQKQGAWNGDFLALFSALEHFRRDLNERHDTKAVLQLAERYVFGLDLFQTLGFFLINPASFEFELAHGAPEREAVSLGQLVEEEIKAGRFAWALRQNAPVFFSPRGEHEPVQGVFHTLGVATHRFGMFCGLLKQERAPSQEITFSLLSMLLGACSDALAGIRISEELHNRVLAANDNLQRALRDNEILARIPAESPAPVLRFDQNGRVLYSNQAGLRVLRLLGWRVGDLISGEWLARLEKAFGERMRHEFEAVFDGRVFTFLVVPVPEAGYANLYGTDITERKRAEAERERLIGELQEALAKVKTLSGLVPICSWCKKIRDDSGFWKEVEVFVGNHSDATFSHGVCPDCQQKWLQGKLKR